ncbi:MAG: hypothetical protein J3K34DRAFT_402029 [Monoraphidium minutum]|nr:MAG: hypothetical protein J3K34DRAFT_402029 [Monoraphidium minutum]
MRSTPLRADKLLKRPALQRTRCRPAALAPRSDDPARRRRRVAAPPAATAPPAAAAAASGMSWGAAIAAAGVVAVGGAAFALSRYLGAAAPAAPAERRAALEAFAAGLSGGEFAGVPEVTAEQLRGLLEGDAKVVVVDVRTPEEQQVSMIPGPPGAVVTRPEFEADPARWRGYQAVCQCTVGYRSGVYAQRIAAAVDGAGPAAAANLRGGILAWTHAGLPLVDPATGAATRRVHVYAPRWALHGDGYAPVAFGTPLLRLVQENVSRMLGLGKAMATT